MKTQQKSIKQYYFYVIALLIPIAFFVLLELGLRAAGYGKELSLFISAPQAFASGEHWVTNPNVADRYFPSGYSTPQPPQDFFKKEKPENGYRIFVMGGSTTASWPYPHNVLFTRILEQRLSDAFPDKYIEVVNTGIAAVNSFTLLDFTDEILEHQPNAILIYAGHNEFYGVLGAGSSQSVGQARWIIKTYLSLLKLKTFQLIHDLISSNIQPDMSSDKNSTGRATLMSQMVGENSIAYGSDTYQNAKANYEANLSEILTKAKAAGVPVMLSELVSNLRDHPPFISVEDGSHMPADLIYEWGQRGLHNGQGPGWPPFSCSGRI